MKQIVNYELEMANTWDDLYAHVHLPGVDVGTGDSVLIQNAPTSLPWGQRRRVEGLAIYQKASSLKKLWIRLIGRFEITMLYEVSFSSTRYSKLHSKKYPHRIYSNSHS